MSSRIITGNSVHDANCLASLITLQGGLPAAMTQAAMNALYVTYYKACRASAIANGCGHEPFDVALRSLGVGV